MTVESTNVQAAEAPQTQAPAPASAAPAQNSFDSVGDAVAELDRREAERRAARRAEKAARAEEVGERRQQLAQDATQGVEDGADDGDDDHVPQNNAVSEGDDADDDFAIDEGSTEGDDAATADDDGEPAEMSTVEIDGQSLEIPQGTPKALVDAVRKLAGDLKADHTRKTMELAEVRRAVAERAAGTEQLMQQLEQAQQAVAGMAQRMLGNPPSIELLHQDAQSYYMQKELYEQRLSQLREFMGQGQQLTQAQRAQQEAAQRERLQEEAAKAVQLLPDLADPAKKRAFTEAAIKAASESGFQPEEVVGIADHRMVHLLHRLVTLEKREAARSAAAGSVKTKLANVPPKVNRPGNATTDNGKAQARARAKAAFMKSNRSLKDARAYLSALD